MKTETKQFPTQIGQSITCDFQENTWTFEMPKKFAWTGGKFAIVPNEDFEEMKNDIVKLRKLLYQVEVFMEQENMNDEFDGIWRDNDEDILAQVKAESLDE